MKKIQDVLFDELRALLSVTGTHGGLMSPSIYDSAQVLRILSAPGRALALSGSGSGSGSGRASAPRPSNVRALGARAADPHPASSSRASGPRAAGSPSALGARAVVSSHAPAAHASASRGPASRAPDSPRALRASCAAALAATPDTAFAAVPPASLAAVPASTLAVVPDAGLAAAPGTPDAARVLALLDVFTVDTAADITNSTDARAAADAAASPVVAWLLAQQRSDGGWGDPVMPLHRDIPTLSAVLALLDQPARKGTRDAIAAGLRFVRNQSAAWSTAHIDDLPIAAEILLPHLLDRVEDRLGPPLDRNAPSHALRCLPREPYARLMELGARKRQIIAHLPLIPGVPWLHVWETWGTEPSLGLMDGAGSIGHSPSATAAWLAAAAPFPALDAHAARARAYLRDVSRATGTGIPGLVPVGAPHDHFERAFVLYALLMAGILDDPRLAQGVTTVLGDLARALGPQGLGMSDHYLPDGDDTSAALAVMHARGLPVDPHLLDRFRKDDHFIAYPGEMNSSPTLTARCIHALAALGETRDLPTFQRYLLDRQEPDGRWTLDKWNRSWLYATSHAVLALLPPQPTPPSSVSPASPASPPSSTRASHAVSTMPLAHADAVRRALDAVLAAQSPDGGWSSDPRSNPRPNPTETAYAVLMLGHLERHGVQHPGLGLALERAHRFLHQAYAPFAPSEAKVKCWISKELYRMERVDTAFELSAMLMLEQRG
ncbi:prenyltransferase/squalene oxidase repeat-containing protein [Chondromyces apiculatus]|nr:prenyltransferase/squalene oxidase repeat-containing protein [Chondromyces apiculatus]